MPLPNAVIAGAPKCGTSSLYYWLLEHPSVCGGVAKESYYLMDRCSAMFKPELNYHDNGIEGYARLFDACSRPSSTVVMEATAGYLYQETALRVLSTLETSPAVFVLVREPAYRVYSTFQYFQQTWSLIDRGLSFQDFVDKVLQQDSSLRWHEFLRDAIRHGEYVDHLLRWREQLGDRLHVLVLEELRSDPLAVVSRVADILGIDPRFYEGFSFHRRNETYRPRSHLLHGLARGVARWFPRGATRRILGRAYYSLNAGPKWQPFSPEELRVLAELREHYQPYNQRLSSEFELDLSPWG